jgi:hypothetical protein
MGSDGWVSALPRDPEKHQEWQDRPFTRPDMARCPAGTKGL